MLCGQRPDRKSDSRRDWSQVNKDTLIRAGPSLAPEVTPLLKAGKGQSLGPSELLEWDKWDFLS